MEKITDFDIEQAVILWTGWKKTPSPLRDDNTIIETFGKTAGQLLLEKIKHLEDDFYRSDARFNASSIEEMESASAKQFMILYPNLSPAIAQAFAWCYSFDYK